VARALEFAAPREVRIVEVPLAEPGPGEVLVRTERSGISGGTELLAYRGELDPSWSLDETLGALGGTFRYPFAYGYSCVGRVERSVGSIAEGELVFAFHPHQDRFVAAESDVVSVAGLDARAATLFPLVETALQVTLDAEAGLGTAVVVLGLGAVGVLTALLAARAGAAVVGADPASSRREAASALGVEAVDPGELPDVVAARTGGRGADVVVEASGNPEALAPALSLLAHEGTALVASWYGSKAVSLPLGAEFHRRRLSIRSSQVSTIPARLSGTWDVPRRRAVVRGLLEELPLKALCTHEFPFERASEAYGALDEGRSGLLHAALRYA
jgi:2-desacetyl-2-hydroxyethyl bacteriochlorophyllide A dehydrogenase